MVGSAVDHPRILAAQKNEKTEHIIYQRFSKITKDSHNKEILLRLAADELKHHDVWQSHTGKEVQPHWFKIRFYCLLSRVMGLSFGLKLMERSEARAKMISRNLVGEPLVQAENVDEDEHERQLLRLINEDRLKYVGAIILGLNDALVELTGALAGFTFAMQSSRLVAMAGLITGIAAALSMGGTSYLSAKSEENSRSPRKFALYTGLTYLLTVFLLILPYLVLNNVYISLGLTLITAIIIILVFNFYISVAKEVSFWHKFREMALLSIGIAGISFGIGFLVRGFLGLEV